MEYLRGVLNELDSFLGGCRAKKKKENDVKFVL